MIQVSRTIIGHVYLTDVSTSVYMSVFSASGFGKQRRFPATHELTSKCTSDLSDWLLDCVVVTKTVNTDNDSALFYRIIALFYSKIALFYNTIALFYRIIALFYVWFIHPYYLYIIFWLLRIIILWFIWEFCELQSNIFYIISCKSLCSMCWWQCCRIMCLHAR